MIFMHFPRLVMCLKFHRNRNRAILFAAVHEQ